MIVTVDEVKTHLRIQHDEEDEYMSPSPTRKAMCPKSRSPSDWPSSS